MGFPRHLIIVQQQYRPDGGAERYVAQTAHALAERGTRVTVLARRWDRAESSAGAVEHVSCDPRGLGRIGRDVAFARRACRLIQDIKPDLVQSQERIPCCDVFRAGGGVHAEWLRQRRRASSSLRSITRSLAPYHRYILHRERELFTRHSLKAIVCNSNMVRREIVERFNVAETKIHVIHNGVDQHIFAPATDMEERRAVRDTLGLRDEDVLALFVGSGFERKGLAQLLHATATAPGVVHIAVVGRDKHERRYRWLAKSLGIERRTHWLGVQTSVAAHYRAADAFALPTLYDPFANVVLEAMACGLPTITSTKCGAVDLIRHDENGFLIDSLDVAALTACLDALCDRHVRERIGAAARETIRPLTWDAAAERMLALFEHVTNG